MEKIPLMIADVRTARKRIAGMAVKTPLKSAPELAASDGNQVHLKLENLQTTGAFKIRGAANKILSLSENERERGVITVSSGNHGRAVAYVCGREGIHAKICVPTTVPENKQAAIRGLGAELVLAGANADEAMIIADEIQADEGLTMVHPFDDLDIIAGQGTIGLELLEDLPELDSVIVPLSGGGLMSGIAFAVKTLNPDVHVVGVSMERGPAMVESMRAGRVVDVIEEPTLADALAGGLNRDNRYTLPMVMEYVDEAVLVSEEEIARGMWHLLSVHHLAAEGGAAVGVSALLAGKVKKVWQEHGRCDQRGQRPDEGYLSCDEDVYGDRMKQPVVLLNEEEIRACAVMDMEAYDAVANGFSALARDEAVLPPIMRIDVAEHEGEVDVKSAYIRGMDSFAIKIAAGFHRNRELGLPTGSGMMVLVSAVTGVPLAVLLDNGYLTDLRTGLAGAIAANHLAPKQVETAGIIGSGMQARWQARGLKLVRDFKRLMVYGIIEEEVDAYVKEMS